MTRWLALGGVVVAVLAAYRVFAIGRKAPLTTAEQMKAAWSGEPVRFKRTQSAQPWKLRIARRIARRKVS